MKLAQKITVGYLRIKFKLLSAISNKKAAEQAFQLFCTPPTRDLKELPAIFRKAEELRFQFNQYTIVGYRWNKGSHRKVLILHGFESTAINFEAYIQPLLDKGYEVLAFDAPAHGRSSGKRITTLIYSDLVKHIHTQYGPIQSYMGHSLGGFALSLAMTEINHDENFHVVLIAPATEMSTAIDNFFDFLRLNNKTRQEFENIVAVTSGHPVSWFSIGRTIKSICAKTLWVHDEADPVTPWRDALKVKIENYSNLQFVLTNGLGHSGIYRDKEVIKLIVDFL